MTTRDGASEGSDTPSIDDGAGRDAERPMFDDAPTRERAVLIDTRARRSDAPPRPRRASGTPTMTMGIVAAPLAIAAPTDRYDVGVIEEALRAERQARSTTSDHNRPAPVAVEAPSIPVAAGPASDSSDARGPLDATRDAVPAPPRDAGRRAWRWRTHAVVPAPVDEVEAATSGKPTQLDLPRLGHLARDRSETTDRYDRVTSRAARTSWGRALAIASAALLALIVTLWIFWR